MASNFGSGRGRGIMPPQPNIPPGGIQMCGICQKSTESATSSTLGGKGASKINEASEMREDNIFCVVGQKVHVECRRKYCHPREIAKVTTNNEFVDPPNSMNLRSGENTFDFNTHCFLCGQTTATKKKCSTSRIVQVRTIEMKKSLLVTCNDRNDTWAKQVQHKLMSVHDLHAADAVYHLMCYTHFRNNKQVPTLFQIETGTDISKPSGRPVEEIRLKAFLEVACFFEANDDEQMTITDLINRMKDNLIDTGYTAYSYRDMKRKLNEHFGDDIIETEINGKCNVITFSHTAKSLLYDLYCNKKVDEETDKLRVVQSCAKLIKQDIKSCGKSSEYYPTFDEMRSLNECSNFLPDSLTLFLKEIFVGKDSEIKIASIGQAIMQAARPRVILAPLQIGLAVQLHHHFASRFLIDTLNCHGFCSSYHEVHKFERSAVMSQKTDIQNFSSQFVQYVADNVDHNVRTLDGNNTFHGMGMISAITPATKLTTVLSKTNVTNNDIASVGRLQIHYHREDRSAMTTLTYNSIAQIHARDPTAQLDLLWKSSILFKPTRPSWSGVMQHVHHGHHHGQSSIQFLPMIDMDPNDTSCIYSTLTYLSDHAKRYGITPIITFDQPLWWKATMIVETEATDSALKEIVLRLGGFHTEMSFLGCIGHLMAASGLQQILELIYAPNAVTHILSGKAISRAIRAHFIVDATLNALVLSKVFNTTIPNTDDSIEYNIVNGDLKVASELYANLIAKRVSVEDVCENGVLVKMQDCINKQFQSLHNSRTAKLWIQYMEMIDILRKFIRAERTGNWLLHLQALSEMLPYFAACGHNAYTKCTNIYLQKMLNLPYEHPEIDSKFKEGFHSIRRSDRQWGGLSSDLVIEQVLMRSLKTSGGLTRGRGMTENQRLLWLLSMPVCADVNNAMQQLTDVTYNSGEQNKEMTVSRQNRDSKDTNTVLSYIDVRNPFSNDYIHLINISTGQHAPNTVNVDTAKAIGHSILNTMNGQTVANHSFKKRDQVVTMNTKYTVKIDNESITVDPQLLFQRLTMAAKAMDDVETAFNYELCSYPPALFDSSLLLRQPQKPALAEAILSLLPSNTSPDVSIPTDVQYVVDGGALIHRMFWSKELTYRDICTQCAEYVYRKYGAAIVVFDGYDAGTTKDMTHFRRTKGYKCVTVKFTEQMAVSTNKDTFLLNKENKQQIILMLSEHLENKNCKVHHATGDADFLIVMKAIESAHSKTTVVIGDDTDLLVLLCYHADTSNQKIFFKSEPKKCTLAKSWDITFVKENLGKEICSYILLIHAILGCDTTSRLYGIGKGVSLKKFRISKWFREQAKIFEAKQSSRKDICAAGEQLLVVIYNGKVNESLNTLRYKKFCEKMSSCSSHIEPKSLPPTSAAAENHCLRVFLQVAQWKGCEQNYNPTDWGWEHSDMGLAPKTTHLPPAPAQLLKIFRCNCQNDCSSMRCTCKKNGMDCSPACGNCRGSSCYNSSTVVEDDDEEDACVLP